MNQSGNSKSRKSNKLEQIRTKGDDFHPINRKIQATCMILLWSLDWFIRVVCFSVTDQSNNFGLWQSSRNCTRPLPFFTHFSRFTFKVIGSVKNWTWGDFVTILNKHKTSTVSALRGYMKEERPCLTTFPNTEKRVGNGTRSGVCLVPEQLSPRPSRSIDCGDVSQAQSQANPGQRAPKRVTEVKYCMRPRDLATAEYFWCSLRCLEMRLDTVLSVSSSQSKLKLGKMEN